MLFSEHSMPNATISGINDMANSIPLFRNTSIAMFRQSTSIHAPGFTTRGCVWQRTNLHNASFLNSIQMEAAANRFEAEKRGFSGESKRKPVHVRSIVIVCLNICCFC